MTDKPPPPQPSSTSTHARGEATGDFLQHISELQALTEFVADAIKTLDVLEIQLRVAGIRVAMVRMQEPVHFIVKSVLLDLFSANNYPAIEAFIRIEDLNAERGEKISDAYQRIVNRLGRTSSLQDHDMLMLLRAGDFPAALQFLSFTDDDTTTPLREIEGKRLKTIAATAVKCLCTPRESLEWIGKTSPSEKEETTATKLLATLEYARPLFRQWSCADAERLTELQCYRLRLGLLRAYARVNGNVMATSSPYQSVIHRMREGHPATAARIALLWAVSLHCLFYNDPWRQQIPLSFVLDEDLLLQEVEIACAVLAEIRTPEKSIAGLLDHFRRGLADALGTPEPLKDSDSKLPRQEVSVLPARSFGESPDVDVDLVRWFTTPWRAPS